MPDTKQMEMLQAIVTRMATNSFTAKGWSITLGTAALGFAVKENKAAFYEIGFLPVILFAWVDAYYLTLERKFRGLFTQAAEAYGQGKEPDFVMTFDEPSFLEIIVTLVSPSVWLVHGALIVVLIAARWLL